MHTNRRKHFPAILLSLSVLALSGFGPSHAQASEIMVSSTGSKVSASATVRFRIVVAETIRLGDEQQRQPVTAPDTIRTVTLQDDRQLVTFARP